MEKSTRAGWPLVALPAICRLEYNGLSMVLSGENEYSMTIYISVE